MRFFSYFCIIFENMTGYLAPQTLTAENVPLGKPLRTKGCIVFLVTGGAAVAMCNFKRWPLRKNNLMVIFPDLMFHIERTSETFTAQYFEFPQEITDDITYPISAPLADYIYEYPVIDASAYSRELSVWLDSLNTIGRIDTATEQALALLARNHWQNFFIALDAFAKPFVTKVSEIPTSSTRRVFNRFCQLMCDHCHKHRDVKFYADVLCITPYYLGRITNSTFSASPKELIDRQVIIEIKELLRSSALSVKEIAHRYNFENTSYLSRYFRRLTGQTPAEYRHNT